jgi:hypothetical protein
MLHCNGPLSRPLRSLAATAPECPIHGETPTMAFPPVIVAIAGTVAVVEGAAEGDLICRNSLHICEEAVFKTKYKRLTI